MRGRSGALLAALAPRRLPRRLCSAALQAHHSFYIDGEWAPPVQGVEPHQVINPATEQPIATITLGSPADVDAAVRAAQRALPSWSATSREERLAMLEQLAAIYAARQGEVAQAISSEMGAPIRLATRAQAAAGLAHLRQFVRVLRGFEFEQPLRAGPSLLRGGRRAGHRSRERQDGQPAEQWGPGDRLALGSALRSGPPPEAAPDAAGAHASASRSRSSRWLGSMDGRASVAEPSSWSTTSAGSGREL